MNQAFWEAFKLTPNSVQTGYWFIEADSNYTPSEELSSFLDKGPAPVYVGFGSISDKKNAKRITDIIISALQKTGQRGILATGWNGIEDVFRDKLSDTVSEPATEETPG